MSCINVLGYCLIYLTTHAAYAFVTNDKLGYSNAFQYGTHLLQPEAYAGFSNSGFSQLPPAVGNMDLNLNQDNQKAPYFKTLLEAGSRRKFDRQFKRFEDDVTTTTRGDFTGASGQSTLSTVAQEVQRYIDSTENPCENFFKYACGGYVQNTSRPSGFASSIQSPGQEVIKVIKTVLQRDESPTDTGVLLKAKLLYKSCMDENAIEQRGTKPILKFFADKGGLPVLGWWDHQHFDWIGMLAHTRPLLVDYGFHYQPSGTIIGMIIQKDFGKQGKYAIYLDQPSLGQYGFSGLINHEVYRLGRNAFYNKAYEDYLIDVAVTLGAQPDIAKQDMRDVVTFETELANIMLFEEERRLVESRYKRVSILEMSLRYPKIDWLRFLQKVLSYANINVRVSDDIILWASPYYDKLCDILARTSNRTLANYILIRAMQPLITGLNRHMQYIGLRYIATVDGAYAPRLPDRSDFCTNIVNSNMNWITSRVYVENGVRVEHLAAARTIKDYVRAAHTHLIKRSKWLDVTTKRAVLKKMNLIQDKIGFPLELLDEKYLATYYKDFVIGGNYFENMQNLLGQNYIKTLQKLVNPPVSEWILRPASVNALHNLGTQSIEIPAGIIQEPFFSPQYPASMNFGGIGWLFGHEYVHGFEVTGIKFDWNGLIRRTWTDSSIHNFAARANCYVNQYSKFYIPEADLSIVNGNKTLNENIPDNVGLKSSYDAYKRWKAASNIEDGVDGLPYTGEQLFFINYARTFCSDASKVFLQKLPYIDHHSIDPIRIIGPLRNSREFSAAFQCPTGSFMNPMKKCDFW